MIALPIINDALFAAGFAGFAEAPGAEATALGVRLLNDLLNQWSTKSIYNPRVYRESFLSNGTADYVLGTIQGDPPPDAPTNPAAISNIVVKSGSVVWPVEVRSILDWPSVMPKNITGVPQVAFWDYQSEQSELKLWPIPSGGYEIEVTGMPFIGNIGNAQDDIPLPLEYGEPLKWTLAVALIPFLPPDININPKVFEYLERKMNTSISGIKRKNSKLRSQAICSDMPGIASSGKSDGYWTWTGRAI